MFTLTLPFVSRKSVVSLQQENDRLQREIVRLHQVATTDSLTGCKNFLAFEEAINLEWRRAVRSGHELAVVFIDLDNFKSHNAAVGHARANNRLKAVGRILLSHTRRPGENVFRYGGDEFVLVLPEVGLESARGLAEDVCAAVRVAGFTVSAGVASSPVANSCLTPISGEAPPIPKGAQKLSGDLGRWLQLLEMANGAMHSAKVAGRDRVVVGDRASAQFSRFKL